MMKRDKIVQITQMLRETMRPMSIFEDPNGACSHPADWYTWNHHVAYGTSNTPPRIGSRTATILNDKRWGLTLFLDTNVLANGIFEASERWTIFPWASDPFVDPGGVFGQPFFWSMGINRSNPVGVDAGEKYQGICVGGNWAINTPWQTNWASSSSCDGRIGLHWNYTTSKWQIQLASGVSPDPPYLIDCDIQPEFSVDLAPAEISIVWVPMDSAGRNSRIMALHNGVMIHDLRDHAFANELQLYTSVVGPGFYWTNGSDGASRAAEAGYYTGRFWFPHPRYTQP